MAPEEGRSAIAAASRAIADLRLGRLDDETTANVGLITGGTAKNIVPERCSFSIDVRSHSEQKLSGLVREILETITFAAALEQCEAETTVEESYRGYRFNRGDLRFRSRARHSGAQGSSRSSGSPAAGPTRTSSTSVARPA